jgi:hypothetical protein
VERGAAAAEVGLAAGWLHRADVKDVCRVNGTDFLLFRFLLNLLPQGGK